MEFITALWLPIILSAVLVFIASSIIWMATPLHKKDYLTPPNEAAVASALRDNAYPAGSYFVPHCGGGDLKDPEFAARMKSGPWALIHVMPVAPSFGRCLGQWFTLQVVLSVLVAYAASAALAMGADAPDYLKVFQVVGAIALLAHAGATAQDSIWKGVLWKNTAVKLFDGLIYALLTAGTFAWLWPRAIAG